MDRTGQIAQLIAPTVEAMGYELLRVILIGTQRQTLQVMAERRDGRAMSVDDCADISRSISAVLDVEDPLSGAYVLEVSSPGIDRPLVRLKDFERFAGFEARVETTQPQAGQRRFRGRLLGLAGEDVRLAIDAGEVLIPFTAIHRAKLVLTDELIAAAQAEMQAAQAAGVGADEAELRDLGGAGAA